MNDEADSIDDRDASSAAQLIARCAADRPRYSRTCIRSVTCAVNAKHAVFNPSITRSSGTPRGTVPPRALRSQHQLRHHA
jgi:hypothetical protein